MDRIELTSKDVEKLLVWRDEHKELVRSHPNPIKAIDIIITDTGYRIRGIRDSKILTLYLSSNGNRLGKCLFRKSYDGMFIARKKEIMLDKTFTKEQAGEAAQSMLTIYCSLMALMTYGNEYTEENSTSHRSSSAQEPQKAAKRNPKTRTTYILQQKNNALTASPKGFHASPSGTFSVRGHYRHYKSGKVVWIAEYKKGTGKNKLKTYKIGGKNNED